MILFNQPTRTGEEVYHIQQAIDYGRLQGGGIYTKKCTEWMEEKFSVSKVLLTSSGTAALDMAAYLCEIQPGDEVILPSFTFSSTAIAFVRVGAKLVFVDICPETMNCSAKEIEKAITSKTKVIVVMHYAGVACEMQHIMKLASEHGILVVEDAAHGFMGKYHNKYLGTIGHLGCYSFHDTKNFTMGEGGALVINDSTFIERAEILLEKGTNRTKFIKGEIDKYTWVDIGDSYLASELNASFLWSQLQNAEEIHRNRVETWALYFRLLQGLEEKGALELPEIPVHCEHSAHVFYIKVKNEQVREQLLLFLKERGVMTAFHYVPLHKSPAGLKYGYFSGNDCFTVRESERLLRLPIYYGMKDKDILYVVNMIKSFYDLKG